MKWHKMLNRRERETVTVILFHFSALVFAWDPHGMAVCTFFLPLITEPETCNQLCFID